ADPLQLKPQKCGDVGCTVVILAMENVQVPVVIQVTDPGSGEDVLEFFLLIDRIFPAGGKIDGNQSIRNVADITAETGTAIKFIDAEDCFTATVAIEITGNR